jgi:hypothetical protein
MSQTILIHSNEDLKKIYSLNLNTYVGTDVIDRKNSEDAIGLIQILPQVSLIITQAKIGADNTAQEIFNYIQLGGLDIPMIVLGKCDELNDVVQVLDEEIQWEQLIKAASNLLGVTPDDLVKKVKPDYVPIDVFYFYEITSTPCDIYIRIQKSPTNVQFVKRLHAQDTFTQEDIKKYEEQGLKNFYVGKDYQQYFVTYVTNQLLKKLGKEDLTLSERIHATANSYDIVGDYIRKVGLDESITELADASIQSMVKSVNENPKLANLLKLLLSSKISYAYQHAHLVTVIGDFILSKQKWYEPKFLDIFTFVAFFSDITLKSVEQIRINSQFDLDNSGLSPEEKEEVIHHALKASLLVKDHPLHTKHIEQIIKEHQGNPEGIGLLEQPSEDIHPIAKVFVVTDAFVKIMLDPNGPKNKKDILTILYAQYTNESYQKIIKYLEQKID